MDSTARFWLTGELEIDFLTNKAYHKKTEVKLSDLSFNTMTALINAFPKPLSNDELIAQVWEQTAVSSETVTQRVALIRKALNEAGLDAKKYLAATRLVGYRWLEPCVENLDRSKKKNSLLVIIIFAAFVGLGFWAIWHYHQTPKPITKTSASISAQDLASQAWSYLDKHNAQSNQLAIGLFRQALALHANDVNALTGLSIALSHEVTKFNQHGSLLIEARQLAQQATQLQPNYAKAWAALAFVDDANGDIDSAIMGYEKAIELEPSNSSAIGSLAYLYGVKGRLIDALRLNLPVLNSKQRYLNLQVAQVLALLGFDVLAEQWFYKADVLSPDNVFATHARAKFYLSNNQTKKALEIINQARNRGIIRPELPNLMGLIAWKEGDLIQADNYFSQAIVIDKEDMQTQLLKQALAAINQQSTLSAGDPLLVVYSWPDQSVNQAHYYASMGQSEAAFTALDKAFEQGFRDHAWLNWLPAFEVLKSDPKWSEIMMTMQGDVDKQRQFLLTVDWLPTSFLDPQN